MRKAVVMFSCLLATLAVSNGRSSPEQWQWNLYDLLQQTTLVVEGDVSIDFMFGLPGYNVFHLKNGQVLPGGTPIRASWYIVSGPPTTGANTPPWFSASRYLLFLAPVSDVTWSQVVATRTQKLAAKEQSAEALHSAIQPLPDRALVYEVVGHWKGAIDMHSQPGHANSAIRRQYGITSAEIILESVQQVLALVNYGAPFTSSNPLTDAFMQQFDAARFTCDPDSRVRKHWLLSPRTNPSVTDPTRFRVREYAPSAQLYVPPAYFE